MTPKHIPEDTLLLGKGQDDQAADELRAEAADLFRKVRLTFAASSSADLASGAFASDDLESGVLTRDTFVRGTLFSAGLSVNLVLLCSLAWAVRR